MQPALQVQIDHARHVHREAVRAHQRALDALLAQEVGAAQFDVHARRDHADHIGRATAAQHAPGLLDRGLQADGLEAVVHAAAGHLDDLLDRVVATGIDHVGGTELARQG